jgi:alkylation response protein AidB-like acyl-CoA dehydrogenase
VLKAVEAGLAEPTLLQLLDRAEENEEHPSEAIARLGERGLFELFGEGPHVSAWHQGALLALAARRSGGLAVTLAGHAFSLLPLHVGGEQKQREELFALVRKGELGALLLTELEHGSNLHAHAARAEPSGAGDYRITGEKQLINGGSHHSQLVALLRTRVAREGEEASGDFSLLWISRGADASVKTLPRWHTLPARAADIAGVRFEGTQVGAHRRIGEEGHGFALVRQTLAFSRAAVSALASGLSSRAVELSQAHARSRMLYGAPILKLDAIADHLLRQEALELLGTSLSVKATAVLNLHGPAAIHYASAAKLVGAALAEEVVTEGRRVLGARALLRAMPYERLVRDVTLYPVLDGTSHVVLEELHWRLAQLAAREAEGDSPGETLQRLREVYTAAPQPLTTLSRKKERTFLLSPETHARALAEVSSSSGSAARALAELLSTLLDLVRTMRASGLWDADQGYRFDAGELLGWSEALLATVELGDAGAREVLGLPSVGGMNARLGYALTWFAGRLAARLRELWLRSGLAEGVLAAQRIDPIQQGLWESMARWREQRRAELRG